MQTITVFTGDGGMITTPEVAQIEITHDHVVFWLRTKPIDRPEGLRKMPDVLIEKWVKIDVL